MKIVITILVLMTLSGIFAAITGVERISLVGHRTVVVYHSFNGRLASTGVAICSGVAAFGCWKRKIYAWWKVTAMLLLCAGYGVVLIVWNTIVTQMDFLGIALGILGEGAKIAALCWVLVTWWIPKKTEFKPAHP